MLESKHHKTMQQGLITMKSELWWYAIKNWIVCDSRNSTSEHDTTKLVASLHSESTIHSNVTNISTFAYC